MNVNKKSLKKIVLISMTWFLILSGVSFAQDGGSGGGPDGGSSGAGESATLDFQLNNPLSDEINSIPVLISKILDIVIFIMVPIITLMVIYTGFMFVVARGKPAELEKAKKALMWTLIGAAIILGAWTLAEVLGGTIDCLKPGVTC
ncbi:MAG: hypothetical protein H6791_01475 [Candidatus Nomurabacteria bacterium]|nr:MAG: hypothetical protein H6791_01475 [Candidatus Nomurabacteria bacterium]